MATINKKSLLPKNTETTHEGAPAHPRILTPLEQLRRSILACFLWEDQFYEDGKSIADRITENALKVDPVELAALALEVRKVHNLRHAPLLLLDVLTKTGAGKPGLVKNAIANTISRPDEITEMLAVYWRNGKKRPLSGQLKQGLAMALNKFNEYSLAKYNRDGAIKLRDVLFLTNAKPKDEEQAAIFKKLAEKTLATPDTWEVALSGGADKKETFERLIREGKLGYFALIRNLRNMILADCDLELVRNAITARQNGAEKLLPFRYIAAARHAKQLEPALDQALLAAISEMPPLPGKTIVLVDVSGSMFSPLSAKSDLSRADAAATLASIIPGNLQVFSFSNSLVECPPRKGMAGVESILSSQSHGGTDCGGAVKLVNQMKHDRLIVITDEQSHTVVPAPVAKHAYMINVASYRNGVGYGKWTHIDGFSEKVLTWIHEFEAMNAKD